MTDHPKWETVLSTIARSAPHMSDTARLKMADDICEALGIETGGDEYSTSVIGPDVPLVNAIKRLLEFRPEFGYPSEFAEFVAATDWRDVDDPNVQGLALNDRQVWWAEQNGMPTFELVESTRTGRKFKRRVVPDEGACKLLSQPVYYPILGKEDGRTLTAYIRQVKRLAGLGDEDF